jgi:hypothetical protein
MMAEEIKPANIYRPHRVRPLSREDNDEDEERFHKKLAELVGEPEADEQGADSSPRRQTDSDQAAADDRTGPEPECGRNLDVRT